MPAGFHPVTGALRWESDADLTRCNTLRLPSRCRHLALAADEAAVRDALGRAADAALPVYVLGEGSNVVLPPHIEGVVLRLTMDALQELDGEGAGENGARFEIGAGHDWDRCVRMLAGRGLWGIENLALIPGTVGAAPVQNIGAYGQEVSASCSGVRVLDRRDGRIEEWSNAACGFGYRDSRFRRDPDHWLILAVRLDLKRQGIAERHYPGLDEALAGQPAPTPLQVAEAVSAIRRRRLPDPEALPNAGSFFKNPVIDADRFDALRTRWPDLPGHVQEARSVTEGMTKGVKVPAAWLIEQCGWRGRQEGGVGVAAGHALVLVHHGGADGRDLLALAARIRESVAERFGVVLEQEPLLLGWDTHSGAEVA